MASPPKAPGNKGKQPAYQLTLPATPPPKKPAFPLTSPESPLSREQPAPLAKNQMSTVPLGNSVSVAVNHHLSLSLNGLTALLAAPVDGQYG